MLLSLVLLAGLLTAGVLLSLVMSRVGTPAPGPLAAGIPLATASATSAQADHPASLAIDGDPTTAWVATAGDGGEAEWLEVALEDPAAISRLVVWNGQQADEVTWAANGWASVIRLEVGDRQFRVGLQDVLGPQAIDLREPVVADRVRLVVEQAQPGSRSAALGISEVVVEAMPAAGPAPRSSAGAGG